MQDTLLHVNIDGVETFLALATDEEINILVTLLARELDVCVVQILSVRNLQGKETEAIESIEHTSSMCVGKTRYDQNFPRGTIVRPYEEFIAPLATAGIPAIDRVVSFVAENCFAQRESDILASASEA
jgi:hypothetical protein